jgi:hypothetical protein
MFDDLKRFGSKDRDLAWIDRDASIDGGLMRWHVRERAGNAT